MPSGRRFVDGGHVWGNVGLVAVSVIVQVNTTIITTVTIMMILSMLMIIIIIISIINLIRVVIRSSRLRCSGDVVSRTHDEAFTNVVLSRQIHRPIGQAAIRALSAQVKANLKRTCAHIG